MCQCVLAISGNGLAFCKDFAWPFQRLVAKKVSNNWPKPLEDVGQLPQGVLKELSCICQGAHRRFDQESSHILARTVQTPQNSRTTPPRCLQGFNDFWRLSNDLFQKSHREAAQDWTNVAQNIEIVSMSPLKEALLSLSKKHRNWPKHFKQIRGAFRIFP